MFGDSHPKSTAQLQRKHCSTNNGISILRSKQGGVVDFG
jgi:hypothetical protein